MGEGIKEMQGEMNDERYSRQALFDQIGGKGQRKIQESSAVIVGCGALGTAIANNLARSGVGRIRIVDRDFVELDNLQRQVLFDEEDARRRLPKAIAAVRRLKEINSSIELEPVVCDLNPKNVEQLINGFSIVLDATDNLETRFLLNDACVKDGIPWVYGAAVGSTGMMMPIVPGRTPCLRCFVEEIPHPGTLPTCDRAGILNSVTGLVACLQSAAALRMFTGAPEVPCQLLFVDVWKNGLHSLEVSRKENCSTCVRRKFEFLQAKATSWTTILCGRNTVQICPPEERTVCLDALAKSLSHAGNVSHNGFLLTLKLDNRELIVFPTGRAMIRGTTDESVARSLYAKYVGM